MPGEVKGEKQVEKKEWTPLWEKYKNVSEADKIIKTEVGEFELLIDDQEDEVILRNLEKSADYLNKTENLPKMKAFNNYMKERINKAWVQKSDEFAKISAHLYRKYEKAYLEKGESSNWEKLEKEAEKALRGVQERDKASEEIRKNANIMEMEQSIDELLADRKERTDSPAYSGVWNAANDYKKLIKEEPEERAKTSNSEWKAQVVALKKLLSKLEWYASRRYRKHYGTIKGRKRMDRVTKLIALTGSVLEVEPAVTLMRDTMEKRDNIADDLKKNFSEDVNELSKVNKGALTGRWADILLPYERDKTGKVTKETQANYEDNWETIQAFKSNEDEIRLTMIAKIYQRLSKFDINENINDFYKKATGSEDATGSENATASKNAVSLYATIISLLQMERNRYDSMKKELPPELIYMENVVTSPKYAFFMTGMKAYMKSYGFDGDSGAVLNTKSSKKDSVTFRQSAKQALDMAKKAEEPDIKEDMEVALQERVNQFRQKPQYRENLRQQLQEREERETNRKAQRQNYIEDTARCVREHITKSKETQRDLIKNFAEYFVDDKLEEAGRINPLKTTSTRLRDLMLIYKRDEDGNITEETRKNFDTNKKLMQLVTSHDATDRIAAMAYIFLNLKKTCYTRDEDLTEENMLDKFRGEYQSDSLQQGAYNVMMDIINEEVIRTKGNALLDYMKKQNDSVNMSSMRQLVNGYFELNGYDVTGTKLPESEKAVKQQVYELKKKFFKDEVRNEKNENNGGFILPDVKKEDELRALCREKGLM